MRAVLLLLPLACSSPRAPTWADVSPASDALLFEDARVFDGERVLRADVLVRGDRIVDVAADLDAAALDAARIDCAGRTLIPGLIDAHAHVRGARDLDQAAALGVTTVLDMFNDPALIARLQSEAHARPGRASVLSAGVMATVPGGHGDEYGGIPTLTRPDEAQRFVDDRIAEGSSFIKASFDDGHAFGVDLPALSPAALGAVIKAAHARGRIAVVHIGSLAGAKTALALGADGLMHVFADAAPDDEVLALARSHGAFVVPTLSILVRAGALRGRALAIDARVAPYLPVAARASLTRASVVLPGATNDDRHALAAVAALDRAGVPVLVGSDASNPGVAAGATVHGELSLLVHAGLTPTAALRAATSAAADAFRLADRGRIASGARADLVLVDGDPTVDIAATRAVVGVWHAGTRVDRETWAATVRAARLSPGVLANFDRGSLDTLAGAGLEVSTDALIGGPSTAQMNREGHALMLSGTLVPPAGDRADAWAGAILWTGRRRMEAGDLSDVGALSFRVRGDGGRYAVLVFTENGGDQPALASAFSAPSMWSDVVVPLAELADVTGIWFGATSEGRAGGFRLALDDITLLGVNAAARP
jgi:imidazolonepropionase-like amidohydrolase